MNDKRQTTDTDEELIDILTAISVVSKRLARNLTIMTALGKKERSQTALIDAVKADLIKI